MSATINAQVLHVVKTSSQWRSSSAVIPIGLLCVETTDDGRTLTKVGDGTHTYSQLEYVTVPIMTGATSVTAGSPGLVPQPEIGDQTKFLSGAGTWIEPANVLYNTTSGWNSQVTLLSKANTLYVYTDYKTTDGEDIPGFKVGNGNAYLIDLPFITDWIIPGLVTTEERNFWNNKVTADIDSNDSECLNLSKNMKE